MSLKSSDYRRRAAACEQQAGQCAEVNERRLYAFLARRWDEMANEADRITCLRPIEELTLNHAA